MRKLGKAVLSLVTIFHLGGLSQADAQKNIGPISGDYTFTEDTTITVPSSSYEDAGINVSSGNTVAVSSPDQIVTISASGERWGIDVRSGGTVTLGETHITAEDLAVRSFGILQLGENSEIIGGSQKNGKGAALVSYTSSGEIVVGNNSSLSGSIWGSGSAAVGADYGGTIKIGDGVSIVNDLTNVVVERDSYRVVAAANSSTIVIGKNSTIEVKIADNSVSVGGNYGVTAQSKSTITIGENATIITNGKNSYGLLSHGSDSKIVLDSNSKIKTTGSNSYGIYASQGGAVKLLGDQTITVDPTKTDFAIRASAEYSTVEANGKLELLGGLCSTKLGKIDLTLQNGSNIQGDVLSLDGGITNLNLISGSTIRGTMDNYTTTALPTGFTTSGEVHVDLGSGSTWDLTGASYINTLNGNGHLIFETDIENNAATVLNVTNVNGASGAHTVAVADTGTGNVSDTHEQLLIKTNGGGATFTMPTLANIGAFQYNIKQVTVTRGISDEWVLYREAGSPLTPTAKAIFNDVRAGYLLNFSENQTFLQRMGELRDEKGSEHNGVWGRMFFGEFNTNSNGSLDGFHQTFKGVQVGVDHRFEQKNNNRAYLGGTFGYTKGNQSYETGSGNIDSYYVGAYGNYIKENGFYVDTLLKFGWQNQKFNLQDNMGNSVKSDSDTKSISWSTEIGQRYYVNPKEKDGWYFEPQAQLTLTHVTGDNFSTSNGMQVKFDSYNSVLGRAGILVGYTIKKNENPVNIYAKISSVHEFKGTLESRMNGDWVRTDLGNNWWTYGVGVTASLNKKHKIYLDIERVNGGQFTQPWSVNGGYRFVW